MLYQEPGYLQMPAEDGGAEALVGYRPGLNEEAHNLQMPLPGSNVQGREPTADLTVQVGTRSKEGPCYIQVAVPRSCEKHRLTTEGESIWALALGQDLIHLKGIALADCL
mmetsp:Transcript_299/g.624  ORF Transcript_299/g.624 Transcript_299/m.624 type:complete len:110 (-) Transcript_299:330-659(-)